MNAFINDLYRTGMNRPASSEDLNYWGGRMADGMSENDVRRHVMNSPEWQINATYGDLLGRAPDQGGYAHYRHLYDTIGHDGLRRDIMRQSEYQNRLLGGPPTSVAQERGRLGAAGINALPGVMSDYELGGQFSILGGPAPDPSSQNILSILGQLFATPPSKQIENTETEEEEDEPKKPGEVNFGRAYGPNPRK